MDTGLILGQGEISLWQCNCHLSVNADSEIMWNKNLCHCGEIGNYCLVTHYIQESQLHVFGPVLRHDQKDVQRA